MVFGEAYQANGRTIIPVSRVRNGTTRPVGVYAIDDDGVSWRPAVDQTRIALLGLLIGLIATTLGTLAVVRRPPWPNLSQTIR